jgi:hypothetical protein
VTDGVVGVKQNAAPDRYIDNETLYVAGQQVYRQRVAVGNLPLDVFKNLVTGQRDNQIEVHFDDTAWADYMGTATTSGGGSGGAASQSNGQVIFTTGTAATGAYRQLTLDVVKYRPVHEVYSAWTAAWVDAPTATSWSYVGFGDAATNQVSTGFNGTSFGIRWVNNGAVTFIAQASWDDPCDGSATSNFTRDGAPEAIDFTLSNIFQLRLGWLGAAGFVVEVFAPDGHWVQLYKLERANTTSTPYLSNPDLGMLVDIGKTSGATALRVACNCWAAGTTSPKGRVSDPLSDRTLVETVRSVNYGRSSAGGTTYVAQKVSPSGAGIVDATGSTVGVTGSVAVTGPLTDTQLRASDVNVADSGEREYTHVVATVTASGDTTIHTPAAGMAIRVHWIYAINDPTAATAPLIKVSLGAVEKYRVYALSKRQLMTGAADAPLVVNLSAAGTVAVTVLLEEV